MTTKKHHKIDDLPSTKTKGYKTHSDGYGQCSNAEFVFSADLEKWLYGKTQIGKKYPNLF